MEASITVAALKSRHEHHESAWAHLSEVLASHSAALPARGFLDSKGGVIELSQVPGGRVAEVPHTRFDSCNPSHGFGHRSWLLDRCARR